MKAFSILALAALLAASGLTACSQISAASPEKAKIRPCGFRPSSAISQISVQVGGQNLIAESANVRNQAPGRQYWPPPLKGLQSVTETQRCFSAPPPRL